MVVAFFSNVGVDVGSDEMILARREHDVWWPITYVGG